MKIIIKESFAESAKIRWQDKEFEVTRQRASYQSDDGESRGKLLVNLKNGQQPYPVGEYTLGDESYQFDSKYQSMNLARELVLIPIKPALQKVG